MARAPLTHEIEELPEADRLEGFPHPRETGRLFGHAAAEHDFAATLATGRLHHGWLIKGQAGIGKATLAYRLACYALASPEERLQPGRTLEVAAEGTASRQVRALSHPGLLLLRRPYDTKNKRHVTSIPIDEVRRLRGFLAHRTAGWRIVIVDSADDLNINAANALLKSLEEPPPQTVFVLVSSEPGRLLPTIRSRCRTLDLKPLSPADVEAAARQAIAAAGGEPEGTRDWTRLARLSQGSVRRLLALDTGGGLALYDSVDRLVRSLPNVDWPAAHQLADSLAPNAAEQRFQLFYELLLDEIARLVRLRAVAASESSPDTALAVRLIPQQRLASWAAMWETLAREKAEATALNLDRKALVIDALQRLETLARRS